MPTCALAFLPCTMKSTLHHTLKPNLRQQKSSNLIKTISDLSSNNLCTMISFSDKEFYILLYYTTGLLQKHTHNPYLVPLRWPSLLWMLKTIIRKVEGKCAKKPQLLGYSCLSPKSIPETFNSDRTINDSVQSIHQIATAILAWWIG